MKRGARERRWGNRWAAALAILLAILLAACEREERRFKNPLAIGERARLEGEREGEGQPPKNPYEKNAWAISQGMRLYTWYNCMGCHAHGGGDIGPALMDARWRYGSDPQAIYDSIMNGRPNGMPSFREKIGSDQAWQIAAYVRSMSGLVPMDSAPGRAEGMAAKKAESMQEEQRPYASGGTPK
jgi:cytochrome c oxidase cbb3-type subunit 3